MMATLAGYPYLLSSLALALLATVVGWAWIGPPPAQGRRTMLLAAFLGAPFALFSFEFIPLYWNPRLLLWFGPASGEDVLFSAAAGAIGWCLAAWPWRNCLRHRLLEDRAGGLGRIAWQELAKRFVIGAAPGIAVAYAMKYGLPGTPVITGTMWGIALGGALLLWRKRALWPLGLTGGVAFAAGYAILLFTLLHLQPWLAAAWQRATQSHLWLGGVPVYEVLWAAGYGAVWPVFVGWCLGTELAQPSQRDQQ